MFYGQPNGEQKTEPQTGLLIVIGRKGSDEKAYLALNIRASPAVASQVTGEPSSSGFADLNSVVEPSPDRDATGDHIRATLASVYRRLSIRFPGHTHFPLHERSSLLRTARRIIPNVGSGFGYASSEDRKWIDHLHSTIIAVCFGSSPRCHGGIARNDDEPPVNADTPATRTTEPKTFQQINAARAKMSGVNKKPLPKERWLAVRMAASP